MSHIGYKLHLQNFISRNGKKLFVYYVSDNLFYAKSIINGSYPFIFISNIRINTIFIYYFKFYKWN